MSAPQGTFSEDIRSLISYLGLEVMGPAEQWQPEPALPMRQTREKLNPFLNMSPKLLTYRTVGFLLLFFCSLKTETSGTGDYICIYYKIFL